MRLNTAIRLYELQDVIEENTRLIEHAFKNNDAAKGCICRSPVRDMTLNYDINGNVTVSFTLEFNCTIAIPPAMSD